MTSIRLLAVVFLFSLLSGSAMAGWLEQIPTGTGNDLYAVAFHPAGDYALVVGRGVYTYDQVSFTQISPLATFQDVAWHPSGDYALLVGLDGVIYLFDGSTFELISSGGMAPLKGVAFSPTGDQAVIVGYGGVILIYEDGVLADRSIYQSRFLEGVSWAPDGSHALIVGIRSFTYEEVIKWDRLCATVQWTGQAVWAGDVDYHPSGEYALIIEDWGHAAQYDEAGYLPLETGFEQDTDGLSCVSWSPDGRLALIVGAWFHQPLEDLQTVIEYDGQRFNALRMSVRKPPYEGVGWNPDSTTALVVGRGGALLQYHPNVQVLGSVYCDSTYYSTGETMNVYLELVNHGDPILVDVYLDALFEEQRYYWPGLVTTPAPLTTVLPHGITRTGPVASIPITHVPGSLFFCWELWVFAEGSMYFDDLYAFHPFYVYASPLRGSSDGGEHPIVQLFHKLQE